MDRGEFTGHGFFLSVIVNNFDLFSASTGFGSGVLVGTDHELLL
ncbi:hypothetical protein CES86_0099 [Brucella lupini]|uniref:Uncharacterized protein n=1 Tax=Brucella lupini TaxID=255457 RepID=A0A256GZ55_9HYPH|nr:hypothetical protein CES86_0099 [Brucella lupini]